MAEVAAAIVLAICHAIAFVCYVIARGIWMCILYAVFAPASVSEFYDG